MTTGAVERRRTSRTRVWYWAVAFPLAYAANITAVFSGVLNSSLAAAVLGAVGCSVISAIAVVMVVSGRQTTFSRPLP